MAILSIGRIGRTYRHIQRYREILTILFRYGFGDLVDSLKVEQYLEIGLNVISRKRRQRVESLSRAERVRVAFEELGPTFIKIGQVFSTRPDLLPVEFIRELAKLQDDVPPFAYARAKKIVEKELRKPLDTVFKEIEEKPLASASLGQVHRARLASGEQVVIKVQRPDIRRTIEVDLEIMLHLAELMERHLEGWEIHHPTRVVEEFAHTLERELDYTIEAAHMERFAMQFVDSSTVYVPKVYREATTSQILTMEYVDGIKVSDIARLEKEGLDRRKIARLGADLIMQQVFVHRFFHADPHPGNIVILPNEVICYLDFGMMGRLDGEIREIFTDLFLAVVRRDETKAMEALLRLISADEEPDRRLLERDMVEFMDQHLYRPLKDLELGKLLHQILEMASKHRLHMPPELFLMLKALATVEGTGRRLDPDFDLMEHATPFVGRIQRERLRPGQIAGDVADSGIEFFRLLKTLPGDLHSILNLARQGRVRLEFEHRGLEPMLFTLDRVSNRLAFAIVLAALIIGSALVVLAGVPPQWHEISIIGLCGFVVAGVMGFWLLVSILKHGRM